MPRNKNHLFGREFNDLEKTKAKVFRCRNKNVPLLRNWNTTKLSEFLLRTAGPQLQNPGEFLAAQKTLAPAPEVWWRTSESDVRSVFTRSCTIVGEEFKKSLWILSPDGTKGAET